MSLTVLLIGNGGREHALAWKLSQSSNVFKIFVAPGNGGTGEGLDKVSNVDIGVEDFNGLVDFAKKQNVNFVVPGPEVPLIGGVTDYFKQSIPNVRVFGPSKAAARLEGSKTFAKDFMNRYKIPTARFKNFSSYDQAKAHIDEIDYPVVIKATGLAAGKGVLMPSSKEEAQAALKDILLNKVFGSAGDEVVVEEYLEGDELSFLSFSDGYTIRSLPAAQDHKRAFDGDLGPNTGGMGAYSPAPIATTALVDEIHKTALQPTIDAMRRHEGHPMVGLLFTGFMITKDGPRVLEYNVRFGDPETQTLLPLMGAHTDLAEIMIACTEGRLDGVDLTIRNESSVTVVAAAEGYPEKYRKGDSIIIDSKAIKRANDHIFHAGTVVKDGKLATAGGRVIAATSTADTLQNALAQAYDIMSSIEWPGKHVRKDIAHRASNAVLANPSTSDQTRMTYEAAGVSITSGNKLVDRIKLAVKSTARPGALGNIGGFGATFDLHEAGYPGAPRLVTGTDGVGTKLKIAQSINSHKTIGIDLVAMNVNDLIVQGATPLFFTDVFSCGKLNVDIAAEVIEGICRGCKEAGCALSGGETAEMADVFLPNVYDIVGATTGAIAHGSKELPDKEAMKDGDCLLGLASSGCHSNGFSLIRKIVEKAGLSYSDPAPWQEDLTVGESLLTPTKIYVKPLLRAIDENLIKGASHITGGGLIENIPRMLPDSLAANLDAQTWETPKVLKWLKKAGNVDNEEFARVFNTGLGMVLIVDQVSVDQAMETLSKQGEKVYRVGTLRHREASACTVSNMAVWDH